MPTLAPEIIEISLGSTRNCKVSLQGKLEPEELLTGTPTIVEIDGENAERTSGDDLLSITNKALTTAVSDIGDEEDVPIARAVQFTVADGVEDPANAYAEPCYLIRITCDTDAGQTVVLVVRLKFVDLKAIEGS